MATIKVHAGDFNRWRKFLALQLAAALTILVPTEANAARIDFACVFTTNSSREVLQLVLDESASAVVVVTPGQEGFAVEAASYSPHQVTFKHNKYTWLLSRLSFELLRMPSDSEDESLIERGKCQRIWKQF